MSLPLVITASGPQPESPADLRTQLITSVAAVVPDYTADLPLSLIEDVASTDVGALVIIDQAQVDAVNSLTIFGVNEFLLLQLGAIFGVQLGAVSNTSVFVVFNSASIGYVIQKGFIISDGTHQYAVQDGGSILSDGNSAPLFCIATLSGTWAVPANTVTTLITSVPGAVTLTVNNPETGTPGGDAESAESYRARCWQAGLASSQGMASYLKTLLSNVSGVQSRLVSVRIVGEHYEVICGGGDPYAVAYAIYQAVFDLPSLTGSTINITGITNATLGVVTTDLNHGLVTGQNNVNIADVVGMTGANGGPYTVTVITEKTFTFGVDTSGFGAYVSGGVVTPNNRNISVSLTSYPDTYTIPFVNPPQQAVTLTVTWNTTAINVVSPDAIAQLCQQPLADYVNSVAVGNPINILTLDSTFRAAVSSVLSPELVTRLVFAVDINGISTPPGAGTQIISGDPESYFFMTATDVTVIQG